MISPIYGLREIDELVNVGEFEIRYFVFIFKGSFPDGLNVFRALVFMAVDSDLKLICAYVLG